MKTVNLALKVQVPDETDEKEVAREIDAVLGEWAGHTPSGRWGDWKLGKTIITRPRADKRRA